MELKLTFYDCYCATESFEINGVEADYDDFGSRVDLDHSNAPDYGCGCRTFIPKLPTQAILDEYKINADEYEEICNKLVAGLSFGRCSWCS